jgi:tetratricopeptide (TPR) repeat protein
MSGAISSLLDQCGRVTGSGIASRDIMLRRSVIIPVAWAVGLWGLLGSLGSATRIQAAAPAPGATNALVIVALKGEVEVLRSGATVWDPAWTNRVEQQRLYVGDRLRTGEKSRAWLRLVNGTTTTVGPQSEVRVVASEPSRSRLSLLRGLFYFFHRSDPDDLEIETPMLAGAVRGTEFSVEVADDGATRIHLLDGVLVAWKGVSPADGVSVASGETLVARPGEAMHRTAILDAVAVIQWCLYYPAVLYVDDLRLVAVADGPLEASIEAYRRGDLLSALALCPVPGVADPVRERIYYAALLLSVGQVQSAEATIDTTLRELSRQTPDRPEAEILAVAEALRVMIAAVQGRSLALPATAEPTFMLATEWMAHSYYHQSRGALAEALTAARRAVELSPAFGHGWARVAELEFSFGHVRRARAALDRARDLAPENAQAMALMGFLLAAESQVGRALLHFEDAIAQDPALGNAWLGRGLTRIRLGDLTGGIEDLQMAYTLEPQRAVLRSYLGKAFDLNRQPGQAQAELDRARALDPGDPTAWLYAALIQRQDGRVNAAIRDLERSKQLNDNRHLFRSQFLLDQDRAVRGANLAEMYSDAGMADVAFREASRAVSSDYANASAHRFLADSYNALRDTGQVMLRYETPWLSEYLVANLLAPVGAGSLSPSVTAQEYSRLFEQDRLGFVSRTTYYSRGDWHQNAVQHGVSGSTAYAAELTYRSESGDRPNNDLDQISVTLRIKEQLTPHDSVYFQSIYYRAEGGDLAPYYDPASANDRLRVEERQAPILLAGYHREWRPGLHTLALAGYLDDTLDVANPSHVSLFNPAPLATNLIPVTLDQAYRSEFRGGTFELQQIWQPGPLTLVGGGRYQGGTFKTSNQHRALTESPSPIVDSLFADYLPDTQTPRSDFERASAYGYAYWQVVEPLQLVAGMSYDHLTHPRNHRHAPLGEGESSTDQWSPKTGLIWTPTERTVVRAAYARSLGGVGLDRSFQLEPTQVAGFTQTYRSLIPEAVTGSNAAERFETAGLSLERSFSPHTYLAVSLDWRSSEVVRDVGVFNLELAPLAGVLPGQARQTFDYEEWVFTASARQLIGPGLSVGVLYQFNRSELESRLDGFDNLAGAVGSTRFVSDQAADLHHLNLFSVYNLPSGWFGRFEALWYRQENHDSTRDLPGSDFWQFNAALGYRFPRRQAEVTVGLFNLTDEDYRLNPLNFTPRLFRDRTLAIDVRFSL